MASGQALFIVFIRSLFTHTFYNALTQDAALDAQPNKNVYVGYKSISLSLSLSLSRISLDSLFSLFCLYLFLIPLSLFFNFMYKVFLYVLLLIWII
jgi:hypothetical protein